MGTRKVRIKKKPLQQAKHGMQIRNDRYSNGKDAYLNQFGEKEMQVNRSLTAVPRHMANLEAEGGEQVMVPGSGGIPETYNVSGNRHAQGGVPLSLQPGSFVFSDHKKGMKIKDPEILAEFGMQVSKKSKKGYTPAQIAKKFDINPYLKVLFNPDSDDMERESAELMIQKYVMQLGKLGLLQESMKGFPQGIPDIAKPYLESMGIDESALTGVAQQGGEQMQQQEQLPQEMANQEMQVQGPPIARFGGGLDKFMPGYQEGGPQQGPPQQQGPNPEEMMQQIAQALQDGASPEEVLQSLVQMGMPDDQAQQMIQAVMQEMQGQMQAPQEGMPPQGGPEGMPPPEMAMAAYGAGVIGDGQQYSYQTGGGVGNKAMAKRFPGLSVAQKGGAFKPHDMFDPNSGMGIHAPTLEDHLKLKEQGYLHEDQMAFGGQAKRKVRVSRMPNMNRGGNISAFNDGYGSFKFGQQGGDLARFIPGYQDGSEVFQSKKDDRKWNNLYEKNLKTAYKEYLETQGIKRKDLNFEDWKQEMQHTNPEVIREAMDATDKGEGAVDLPGIKIPKMNIKGRKEQVKPASGKITFGDPVVFTGEGGSGTQYSEGTGTGTTGGGTTGGGSGTTTRKKVSTKSTKYQNVPDDKKAENLESAKEGDYVKGEGGKWYKVTFGAGTSAYKGTDREKVFGTGENSQAVADRYQFLEDKFKNDPDGKKALADHIRTAAGKEDYYKSRSGKTSHWYKDFEGITDPTKYTDDQLVDAYLTQQKRNLSLGAQGIDPKDFSQNGQLRKDIAPEKREMYKGMGITTDITQAQCRLGGGRQRQRRHGHGGDPGGRGGGGPGVDVRRVGDPSDRNHFSY
jgi:hypothetical protein